MPDNPFTQFDVGYEAATKRQGDIARYRGLQALSQMMGPQMGIPPGMLPQGPQANPPMPGPPMDGAMPPQGGPPMGGPPMGGQPPPPGGSPMGGPASLDPRLSGGMMGGIPGQPVQPQRMLPPGGPPGMPPGGGGMQPPMGGQQQGGGFQTPGQGPLTWQMAVQAIQRANPGAPPNVLAAAVDGMIPLMNADSQQQWRQMREQIMMFSAMQKPQLEAMRQEGATGRTQMQQEGATGRTQMQQEGAGQRAQLGADTRTDIAQDIEGGKQGRFDTTQTRKTGQAQQIGDAIIRGEQPPETTGLWRVGPDVKAYLASKGFDQSKAISEWRGAQAAVRGWNSQRQKYYQGLAQSVTSTIDEVRSLSEQLQLNGLTSWNRIRNLALTKGASNTAAGQQAIAYITAVGTLKSEFANLENGGYAPTEEVWKLANQQINSDYGVKGMDASLDEIQKLINFRTSAIKHSYGVGGENRYQQGDEQEPGKAQFQERFEGLPEGWSVKEHRSEAPGSFKTAMDPAETRRMQRRIEGAEGDKDILRIRKELEKKGIDPDSIPQLRLGGVDLQG